MLCGPGVARVALAKRPNLGGSGTSACAPDITRRHWAVNIRKFVLQAGYLDELVELGTLTPQAAARRRRRAGSSARFGGRRQRE